MIILGDIRARARASLERKLFGSVWMMLLLCNLIYSGIVGVPSSMSTAISRISPALAAGIGFPLMVSTIILEGPMTYGLSRVFHKVAKGNRRVNVGDLFSGFRENFGEALLLGFMRDLFIFLWSLLFLIPGIIKSYAWSMASFIQQESDEKHWRTCLDESADLTYGYKGKLFLLDLSFIGWYLLGALCLGVGMLWVEVYHMEARAHMYEELKKIKRGAMEPAETEEEKPEENEPLFPEFTEPTVSPDPVNAEAPAQTEEDGKSEE